MKNSPRSMPALTLRNAQRMARLDTKALEEFGQRALQKCLQLPRDRGSALSALPEVNVLLVSDRRMAALHWRFMRIAGPTDVITFHHGEIFISVETARRNARRFRTTTDQETSLYLLHGLLHLAGFDDTTPTAARTMKAAETRILSNLARAGPRRSPL